MFHLINKCYLSFDFAYQAGADNVIVSDTLCDRVFREDLESIYSDHIGRKWLKARNWGELVAFFGGEQAIFDFITSYEADRELVFFLDTATFDTMLTKWLRTLLPNVDEEHAWLAYRITMLKFRYIHGFSSLHVDYKNINQRDPWQDLQPVSREAFAALYETATPWDAGDGAWRKHASIEWHVASYLADPNYVHREEFQSRAVKMLRRTVISEMIYWKTNVMYLMFELGRLIPGGPQGDYAGDTVEAIVDRHPEFAFVMDPLFRGDAIDALMDKYDIRDMWALYKLSVARFGHNGHPWVERVCEMVIEPTPNVIDDIIELDRFMAYAGGSFGEYMYGDKINSFLLRMIYNWANTGKLTSVNRLSLVAQSVEDCEPRAEHVDFPSEYPQPWDWRQNVAVTSGAFRGKLEN